MTACAGPTAGSAKSFSSAAAWLKSSSAAAIAALSSASSLSLAFWFPVHSASWTSLTFISSNIFLVLLSTSSCRPPASFMFTTFRSSIPFSFCLLDFEYQAFFPTFTIGLTILTSYECAETASPNLLNSALKTSSSPSASLHSLSASSTLFFNATLPSSTSNSHSRLSRSPFLLSQTPFVSPIICLRPSSPGANIASPYSLAHLSCVSNNPLPLSPPATESS